MKPKITHELYIKGTAKDVAKIINRLSKKFDNIEAVCKSFGKRRVVLE